MWLDWNKVNDLIFLILCKLGFSPWFMDIKGPTEVISLLLKNYLMRVQSCQGNVNLFL